MCGVCKCVLLCACFVFDVSSQILINIVDGKPSQIDTHVFKRSETVDDEESS